MRRNPGKLRRGQVITFRSKGRVRRGRLLGKGRRGKWYIAGRGGKRKYVRVKSILSHGPGALRRRRRSKGRRRSRR